MKLVINAKAILGRAKKGGEKIMKLLKEFLQLFASNPTMKLKMVRDIIVGITAGVSVGGLLLAIDLTNACNE